VPRFASGINPDNIRAASKFITDLKYNGPVVLSYDDTELEQALSVYERSEGFFQIIGNVGEPITIGPGGDLEAVFENAQIVKASKVSSSTALINLNLFNNAD
jgi:hypothetical protein